MTDPTRSVPPPEGFSLAGRSALVTGGGTHLGRAMALALAAQGARVTVLARTEEFLRDTVARLGPGHDLIVADLMEEATYASLAAGGRAFDIVVNNAGGDPWDGAWEAQTTRHWLDTYQLNVVAPNRLAQVLVPGMIARGWGRIIIIASMYGIVAPNPKNRRPGLDCAAYTAAKHASVGLMRFLAARLGRHGITVNAVSPGGFPLPDDDPYMDRMPWRKGDPAFRTMMDEQYPLGRSGHPTDLGGAVAFLASPAAAWVTGHNLVVDGGFTAW
ncbi:MAG: SDR family oxidoreductase [Rhodobacteraceae bacterium]|nr:SDR family oxidoreductase [Paracoccaceae bacterium]